MIPKSFQVWDPHFRIIIYLFLFNFFKVPRGSGRDDHLEEQWNFGKVILCCLVIWFAKVRGCSICKHLCLDASVWQPVKHDEGIQMIDSNVQMCLWCPKMLSGRQLIKFWHIAVLVVLAKVSITITVGSYCSEHLSNRIATTCTCRNLKMLK